MMSVEEVARVLGIRRGSVRQAIRQGRLKAEHFGQRAYAIAPEEVERYRKAPRQPGGRPRKERRPETEAKDA